MVVSFIACSKKCIYSSALKPPAWHRMLPCSPFAPGLGQLFSEIFEKEWRQMQAGLLPQELSTLFQEQEGVVDSLLGILELFEETNRLGNLCTEYQFKDVELGQDQKGRPVLLNGIVDRVDLDREDPLRAFVFDYKTGKATPPSAKSNRWMAACCSSPFTATRSASA